MQAGRPVLRLAVRGADAGPDLLLAAGLQLRHDMRIGDVRPCHRHHVEQPLTDRISRRSDVGDAGRVEHRKADLQLELTHAPQPRRDRRGHRRHVVDGERELGVHPPVDRVEEVEHAGALEDARDGDAIGEGQRGRAAALVDDEAEAHQEIVPDLAPDFLEHHQTEPASVLERAAEAIGAPVHRRRQELADQVAAGQRFDAVQAAPLAAPGRVAVCAHDAGDVVVVHFLRKGAMRGFADHGRADHRQPVAGIRVAAAPKMGDLAHDRRTMAVDALGEALQVGHDLIGSHIELAEGIGAVRRHVGRAADHRQGKAALGLLLVIGLVALSGHTALFKAACMACAHDAIPEADVPNCKGLQ